MSAPYFKEFKIYEFLNPENNKYFTVEFLEYDSGTVETAGANVYKKWDSVMAVKNDGELEWKYNTVVTSNEYSYEWVVSESTLLILLAYTHATDEERKGGWTTVSEIPDRLAELIKKNKLEPIISGSRCRIC